MEYLKAFIVGGAICAVGQALLDKTKMEAGHVMVLFAVVGALLGGVGVYEGLFHFAQAGAVVPISGFGYLIARGAALEANRLGFTGLFTGAFDFIGLPLAVAIVAGVLIALVADPKV